MVEKNRKPISARIEYLGRTPRVFDLPIPYISKSEKTGDVTCDPIGTFPIEDAERLLAISGAEGLFKLVGYDYGDAPDAEKEVKEKVEVLAEAKVDPVCKCGCGSKIVILPQHKYSGIPLYIKGHYRKKSAIPVSSGG